MQENPKPIRPTKKQKELLNFIAAFIAEHGYSPIYREIMSGVGYTSVATVALHVSSLIKRGQLQKRDHSARSLEVVGGTSDKPLLTNEVKPNEEKWLIEKIEHSFKDAEQAAIPNEMEVDNLVVLVGALKILGLEGASQSFATRLRELKAKLDKTQQ